MRCGIAVGCGISVQSEERGKVLCVGGCAVRCGIGVWCGISVQSEERGKVPCVVSCAVRCGTAMPQSEGRWCVLCWLIVIDAISELRNG